MNMTCENVTDLLPDLAAGSLNATDAEALRAHLASCAECAAEWSLIAAMRMAPSASPELVASIAKAVASRPVARPMWGARQLALAATIAVAIIGGGIAVDQMQRESARTVAAPLADSVPAVVAPATTSSEVTVEEPVLGSRSVLPQMNEKQLEALLAQMGS